MEVIFYSNDCPKCKILKEKLKQANIQYLEINDIDVMVSKGFMSMPMLEVGNVPMTFLTATNWINERNK